MQTGIGIRCPDCAPVHESLAPRGGSSRFWAYTLRIGIVVLIAGGAIWALNNADIRDWIDSQQSAIDVPSTPEPQFSPIPTEETQRIAAPAVTTSSATPRPPPTATPNRGAQVRELRLLALELINDDRADHGLPPVALGNNEAAQLHAEDMLMNDYFGHWWADGRKPYMVYSQTGGTSYVSENVATSGFTDNQWQGEGCASFLVRCIVPTPEQAIRDHQWSMMYDDAHADWGHRDNILGESHRAVNIGIAWNNRRVTFVQHFEGGTVTALSLLTLDQGRYLSLAVHKNEPDVAIGGLVAIYYDPLPSPVSSVRNGSLDSYCVGGGVTPQCGDEAIRILDPPPPNHFYSNLDDNEVVASDWQETPNGFTFYADVGDLMRDTGVYTIILWRDTGGRRLTEQLLELSVFVE